MDSKAYGIDGPVVGVHAGELMGARFEFKVNGCVGLGWTDIAVVEIPMNGPMGVVRGSETQTIAAGFPREDIFSLVDGFKDPQSRRATMR